LHLIEQVFDTAPMAGRIGEGRVKEHEVEGLRRSMTVGLPPGQIHRLIDTVDELYAERNAIAAIVAGLGEPWGDLRGRLNELHKILGNWP
jgi:hypothetical protein